VTTPEDAHLRGVGDRIEALVTKLGSHADPRTKAEVDELVRLLVELYGAGLHRMLTIIDETSPGATELFARFLGDDLVASLLVLHDLHPLDLTTRVQAALERVRTSLDGVARGAEVELAGIEEDVVRLRVVAPSHGCGSPGAALKEAVQAELWRAVPEVSVEVETRTVEAPPRPVPIALRRRAG
jgi:Fe-S cluster biogenesis protein NfuA